MSLLAAGHLDPEVEPTLNARFLPEVKLSVGSVDGITVDAEASANVFGTASWPSGESAPDLGRHQALPRLAPSSTAHFEARAGLQKINFGSATLFRPLMWFDSLDPRDPLQLTDGVYALLLRYFTTSNASFSAWTMYGNDARRGGTARPARPEGSRVSAATSKSRSSRGSLAPPTTAAKPSSTVSCP